MSDLSDLLMDSPSPPSTPDRAALDDIPDLSNRVVFVTRADTDTGKEIARVFLERNARVYLGCQASNIGKRLSAELKMITAKGAAPWLPIDLSNLRTVEAAAREFLKKETRLDFLFLSSRALGPPGQTPKRSQLDERANTDILGRFYLLQILTPNLINTADSMCLDGKPRVINISTLENNGRIPRSIAPHFTVVTKTFGAPRRSQFQEESLFSDALARKYGPQGLISIFLREGAFMAGSHQERSILISSFISWMLWPVSRGAISSLYGSSSFNEVGIAAFATVSMGASTRLLTYWCPHLQNPTPLARIGRAKVTKDEEKEQEDFWSWLKAEVEIHESE
ncbi:uncharacterized protein EI90DRAFT_3114951 [Cantharellus anzutake]|uniref:uncharacterized protein n=1 Tax=Cantharellus anzutake TaxID=1750568 RepID=UPI0019087CB1|nr:uncharacterized protein EI90DRAFT_3114951 [Cantharellus anzutake]KAF8344197.1 hypothetical protein EI90DRAFT_3114951 [Cantharellus anzutake]